MVDGARGRLTGFTCPECGGAVWEQTSAETVVFECRIGHRYAADAMLVEHAAAREATLWAALRLTAEHAALRRRLADLVGLPVAVDNDAKAAATGEYVTRGRESGDMIYVKAGTGIGACLVSGGQIYRGGRGLSGDVTHVRVADSGERHCSCGSRGCLETVASGAALARQLAEQGSSATTIRDIVAAVSDADPTVVTMVRHAGRLLGVALSGLVNFLNPDAVVIGGALSSLDVYVAATRGMLYERCLPSMTQSLTIEASVAGPDAALVGLGHLLRTTADVRPS
jgi:predicted NBD/HSP70 family sugar kinase